MIFQSPYPSVEVPDVSLAEFILGRAEKWGDKPALIDGPSGRTITYAELVTAIKRVAAGLAAHGLKKGEVVAIFSPNLPEYAIAFHAVSAAGGINTTVNPTYTAEELAFQLKDARAKYLITIPPLLDKSIEAAKGTAVEEIFVFGEAEGATPFATLMQNDGQMPAIEINPREDLVALPYSSGTTGLPKGVMLTHHNLVANTCQCYDIEQFDDKDTLIGILPFYHIYGMEVILNFGLAKGATIVTMPRFDLEQFLQIMQGNGVTRAYLVPPIVLALAKHPLVDSYDLSKLKLIMSGAAPLSESLARAVGERLGVVVKQGYGLTECSPVTHLNPDTPNKIKLGAIGPVIPNSESKVVNYEDGTELGANQEGEVWVRGPQVMKGYLNNPSATAAMIDMDGWLHTGDVGYADDDGYFYIVDRVKELIKYKGMQVAPAELEALLLTYPAVADAAVIPIPDEEAGEIPKAYVVLKSEATTSEIMAYVAQHVAPYKKIRQMEFVKVIPKSTSGKILRRLLRDQEKERRERQAKLLQSENLKTTNPPPMGG